MVELLILGTGTWYRVKVLEYSNLICPSRPNTLLPTFARSWLMALEIAGTVRDAFHITSARLKSRSEEGGSANVRARVLYLLSVSVPCSIDVAVTATDLAVCAINVAI